MLTLKKKKPITETEIVSGQIRVFDIKKGQLKVNCAFAELGVEVTRRKGLTLVTVFKKPEAGTGL